MTRSILKIVFKFMTLCKCSEIKDNRMPSEKYTHMGERKREGGGESERERGKRERGRDRPTDRQTVRQRPTPHLPFHTKKWAGSQTQVPSEGGVHTELITHCPGPLHAPPTGDNSWQLPSS